MAAEASGTAAPRRQMQYRRRLRSRIILSFVLLGLGLTTLFAFATLYLSDKVEEQTIGRAVQRNVDEYAARFAEDRTAEWAPINEYKGYVYGPSKRGNVPSDWAALPTGVHIITGEENGEAFSYRLVVRKDPQYWFFVAQDLTRVSQIREQMKRSLTAAVAVFTLFSLFIGWWAASRVMSPVSDLAHRLRKSDGNSEPQPLAPHFAGDEVGELARALDDYSMRLTEVVKRDREFNADVSHELRTPLAVVKGAVELLLAKPDLDEKTHARLQRIQRAERQCTDLISALLLLSRNERGHGATDVARVADQLLEAHRTQVGAKPLVLRLDGAPGQVVVDAPEAAVNVALGNLVGNAVKYTTEGEVVVRLRDGAVDVIDSGPGLSAEDAAKLFERGYRGSHAEHTQGGGIGLSIVRRLCALYGWSVRVVPGDSRGVVATLSFTPAGGGA